MMMLDPNTVQVLFADLQPQIVAQSKTNKPDALARSAAVLTQVVGCCSFRCTLASCRKAGIGPS
jgi:hypothetical protein